MALGDITTIIADRAFAVELLASTTAANGIPTAGDGIDGNILRIRNQMPEKVRIGIKSTAGSGVMTVTLRVWHRFGATIGWMVGSVIESSSATPQTAAAIAETGADTIAYTTVVDYPVGADRIYLEVVAIAGTAPAVTGYAIVGG